MECNGKRIHQISYENCTRKQRSSRNFQPSSSYRNIQAIFAYPNRLFTENSRWVPLIDGENQPGAQLIRYYTSHIPPFHQRKKKLCLLIFVMAWPPSFFTLKKKKKKKVRIGSDVLLFPKLKIRLRNKYRPQMIRISTRTSRKI